MILQENVAKAVIKDLERGKICDSVSKQQEARISNLKSAVTDLQNTVRTQDSIISTWKSISKVDDKIVTKIRGKPISAFIGTQIPMIGEQNINFYGKVLLRYNNLYGGPYYSLSPSMPYTYGIILEYKLF